jgi:stage V sporulation protein B
LKRIKVIFFNLLTLTAASLLLRTIGMSFQVYLSKKIGPAGIGLLQLIMSIYFLAATFAISGIRLAATRLAAEELGMGREAGARKAIKICLCYSLIFSIVFAILLFCCADFIGRVWLGDARTIFSLRILALSLPFLAICAVMGGYFTAVRRVLKLSAVMIAEQVFRIAATVICLLALLPRGLEYACAGIAIGNCIGEITSCLLLFVLYRLDIRQYENQESSPDLLPRMLRIALPVAFSAYVTSIIRTVQQTLIPYGLKKSGASSERALTTYGTIQGMAIPLLMFPAVLLYAISDLIVPELAECQAQGRPNRLSYIINRVLYLGLITSIGVMSVFFRFSADLGSAIYNSSEAGYYLKILAPLVPIMYMDSIVDGMLKGTGQQLPSMGYNILESLIGVTLIYLLLPKLAVTGYIITLFITRTLNFALSINRLRRVVPLKITAGSICKILFCILNALIISNLILHTLHITWLPLCILITAIAYYLLLRLMSSITGEDLAWFRSIFS